MVSAPCARDQPPALRLEFRPERPLRWRVSTQRGREVGALVTSYAEPLGKTRLNSPTAVLAQLPYFRDFRPQEPTLVALYLVKRENFPNVSAIVLGISSGYSPSQVIWRIVRMNTIPVSHYVAFWTEPMEGKSHRNVNVYSIFLT